MYAATAGYPYFVQAYGKVAWDVAPRSARSPRDDVRVAAPEAEAELAVGFFGSRYERATPAEREYLRAMADVAAVEPRRRPTHGPGLDETESVPTPVVAALLGPQAAVAVAGARRAAEEGPDLQRRAGPDRLHGAALRPVPSSQRLRTSAATAHCGSRGALWL